MRKNILVRATLIFVISMMIIAGNQNTNGQTCPNNYIYPNTMYNVGITWGNSAPPKKLTIFGNAGCGDVAERLEYEGQSIYWGTLALTTPSNYTNYTSIALDPSADIGDLVLSSDNAKHLILTTKNNDGCIKFSTTGNSTELERMRITNIGVGIYNPAPKDALQIGQRMNFHIGANYDFIAYNEYQYDATYRRRITGTTQNKEYASSITFDRYSGLLQLGALEPGDNQTNINYSDANGGYKGIQIGNFGTSPDFRASIGIGSAPWENSKLLVRGYGNSSSLYSMFVIDKDWGTLFCVRDDGNSGFGTTTLNSKVVIKGGNTSSGSSALNVINGSDASLFFIQNDGFAGFGNTSPGSKVVIKGSGTSSATSSLNITNSSDASLLFVRNDGNVGIGFSSSNDLNQKLAVNGKVRIGTNQVNSNSSYYSEYMLSVNGTVIADKVVVSSSEWADFVFNKEYKLMPIEELCKYIHANKKLPDIPNSDEVQKDGIDLGKINSKLLQKIEELTLYIIELKNENQEIKQLIQKK